MVRDTQHNVASVTKHLPGACGGHDARKATCGVRAHGCKEVNILSRVTCLPGVQLAYKEMNLVADCAREARGVQRRARHVPSDVRTLARSIFCNRCAAT